MSKHAKMLGRMRNNPRDWRIEEIEAVARLFGLTVRKPGGSHVVFQKSGCPIEVAVPAHKPIKPVYIMQFIDLIDWKPE